MDLYIGVHVTHISQCQKTMGSYDVIIGMDWLEVHLVVLYYIRNLLHFLDDEGKEKVLRGTNMVVSLQFVSLLYLKISPNKGY